MNIKTYYTHYLFNKMWAKMQKQCVRHMIQQFVETLLVAETWSNFLYVILFFIIAPFRFFFSHSVVDLLPCLGSLSCCMIHCEPTLLSPILLCIMTKQLHFGLVCPKDIVPEVLWLVQMQFCKSKQCCHVLFREKRLSPATCQAGTRNWTQKQR